MEDIVRKWTQSLDEFRAHQAVACLLFYLNQSEQVQRDERALREALADLVRHAETTVDAAAANPVTGVLMTDVPLEDALRELNVHRAFQIWDDAFTQKGVQVCWRLGLIGEAWPAEALSSMAQLVISEKGGVPSFAWGLTPRDDSRSRWRWPLRVGVLPDDPRIVLAVEDARKGIHEKLARLVRLEGANETCDLFLISIERKEQFEGPVRIAATATVVVSETGFFPESPFATSRYALLGFRSHAAAAVHASAPEFIQKLFDAISHNLPLDMAICEASRKSSGPVPPVIVGLPPFFYRTRIVESALTITRQSMLRDVGAETATGLVTELPSYRFERETLGASAMAERTLVLEQQLADVDVTPRELLADARSLPRHVDVDAVLARTPTMGLPTLPHLVSGTINLFDFWIGRSSDGFTGIPIDEGKIDWRNYDEAVDLQIELTTSDGVVLDSPDFGFRELAEKGVVVLDLPSTVLPLSEVGQWLRTAREQWRGARDQQQPQRRHLRTVRLTRGGDSNHAIVPVRIRGDAVTFVGRVVVLQGNRVVMTVAVEGPLIDEGTAARMLFDRIASPDSPNALARSPIKLSVEGILRNDWDELDERRRFDVAFVANNTPDGTPKTTALGGGFACDIAFDQDKDALKLISKHLETLCDEPAQFDGLRSEAYRQFLFELAVHGVTLRQAIVEDTQLQEMVESKQFAERFQIVAAKPERLLPLEFIYEGSAPAHGATVCFHAEAALHAQIASWTEGVRSTRGCPHTCPYREGSQHVCPLRFWATTKTIEREMYDRKKVATAAFQVHKARAVEERDKRFPRPAYAILASSDKAWSADPGRKETLATQLMKTARNAHPVDSWVEWRNDVKEKEPMILLAVAHMENEGINGCLFIGDGSDPHLHWLLDGQVDRDLVRNHSGPVLVILMGCETAQQENRYAGFPARFRNGGADIVMATVSPILGRFGGPLAEELLSQLDRCWADSGSPTTLSELVRRSRVLFASQGNPIGFSLVAYGDADWAFGGR